MQPGPHLGKAVSWYSCLGTHLTNHSGRAGLHPGQRSMVLMASSPLGTEGFQLMQGNSSTVLISPARQRLWECSWEFPECSRQGIVERKTFSLGPLMVLSCARFLVLPSPSETSPGRDSLPEAAFLPVSFVKLSKRSSFCQNCSPLL